MIEPTIGRKVWFWPLSNPEMNWMNDTQPLDATVIYVVNNRQVHLSVTDHLGHDHVAINITLKQPEDSPPSHSYAEWMPYQVKTAST